MERNATHATRVYVDAERMSSSCCPSPVARLLLMLLLLLIVLMVPLLIRMARRSPAAATPHAAALPGGRRVPPRPDAADDHAAAEEPFAAYTCHGCRGRIDDACRACPNCGSCMQANGTITCVPGDARGPFDARDRCLRWWFDRKGICGYPRHVNVGPWTNAQGHMVNTNNNNG